jgi:hypothetical protein
MRRFFFNVGQTQSSQQLTLAGQYDAGHLIASSLGGPDVIQNLVPMARQLNQAGGAWYVMEGYIRMCLGRSNIARGEMRVACTYGNRHSHDPIQRYIPTRIQGYFILYPTSGGMGRRQNFDFPNMSSAMLRQFLQNCV